MADNNKYKIGFVDEAPEWISQFKRFATGIFDVVIFDLTSDTTLDNLVQKIRDEALDCLIVDFELRESELIQFNGDEIVDKIKETTPYFPVFIITSKEPNDVLNQVDDVDIVHFKEVLTKPNNNDSAYNKETFVLQINSKIEHYNNRVKYANEEIERLVQQKAERALTPTEEEQLSEYYLFLEKIYPDEKVLPSNLTRPESISQLNDFVENTKKILEELKKQK